MSRKKGNGPASQENTLDAITSSVNEQCGENTMILGNKAKKDPPRLPVGIFAVDFASGGGVPIHHSTCFWGGDQSAKSFMATSTIRMASRICWRCFKLISDCVCSQSPLVMKSVFVDVEGTHDIEWALNIGAKPEDYFLVQADYGEQYINVAESALRADDCGLVIIDSLAALSPESEFEAPSEDQFYAAQARLIGRAVRKLKQRLIRERKRGHPCAVVFTNQMRMKMGGFGNPETMSGGFGMKHEFSLLFRCGRRSLDKSSDARYIESARNKDLASRQTFMIKKDKVFTMAGSGEYVVIKENMPDAELKKGMVDDFNTVMTYAKDFEVIKKEGAKWVLFDGQHSNKLENIKLYWKRDPDAYERVKMEIIRRAKERIKGPNA